MPREGFSLASKASKVLDENETHTLDESKNVNTVKQSKEPSIKASNTDLEANNQRFQVKIKLLQLSPSCNYFLAYCLLLDDIF